MLQLIFLNLSSNFFFASSIILSGILFVVSSSKIFKKISLALYEWAPVADELKTLDRKIVLNSMILKWENIQEEFSKLVKF